MAIIRCLAISVSHISKDTHDALINRSEFDEMLPYVDNMEDRGLILGVYSDYIEEMIEEGDKSIPDDLWECMLLAYEKDCEWLCLEYCGDEVKDLPVYDW